MKSYQKSLVLVVLFAIIASLCGCGSEKITGPNNSRADQSISSIDPRGSEPQQAARTTGYQAYKTDWQWDWKGPHFTIIFRIPHSTYGITRYAGIPTSCCEGGLNNWLLARKDLGNGWDDCTLVIPKTLRSQYFYLTDWEFSRYFWLWCTYNV